MGVVEITVAGGSIERRAKDCRNFLGSLPAQLRASVDPIYAPVPPGAKADIGLIIGLVVALGGPAVAKQLALAVREWVQRSRHHEIVMTDGDRSLKLSGGASAAENAAAIELFFRDRRL
ncbi:hypothetical protein ACWFRF_22910 [Nocardia sp. NPDC055165]|uniref:hypothetical protein n=1 Tax=Nocardia sp. NPDC056952 TaxID=3345979 RepID=UPI0036286A94